jgi:hypothetical protein
MRRLGMLLLTALLAGALAACGDATSPPLAGGGDVPITQRAIAAMALLHAPTDTTHRQASYTDRRDPEGALGADLRYRGDGESDGDLLRVFLAPGHGPAKPCRELAASDGGCESRKVDGGTLTLSWGLEEPEEDPGYVGVVMQRDDEMLSVTWSGDAITGDPRKQHLFIPIDTMEAIAQDERISLTTSQAVVDAGEKLDDWKGGEPDPHAYDRVPSTDDAIVSSYWLRTGGYGAYHRLGPSPLKAEFGEGAIGGRFTRDDQGRDYPALTIDVLASPQRPDWMERDVCDSARFEGHCLAVPGQRGQRFLAWVPGKAGAGEIWGIQVRADQVVAVRYSDLVVPDSRARVIVLSEWYLLKGLINNRRVGLTTDQEVLDAEF